jgi:large subunit ribosomal protein L18
MTGQNEGRLRRAAKTRRKQHELGIARLAVHRTNHHIYAQIISGDGAKVLAAAGTTTKELRTNLAHGGNKAAAVAVGKLIAEKAKQLGIDAVAFDRGGFKFHGRVKALADAAREGGLKF